jgi:hypothetical protein
MPRSVSFRRRKQPWRWAGTVPSYLWQSPPPDEPEITARGFDPVEEAPANEPPRAPTPEAVFHFRQLVIDARQPPEDLEAWRRARAMNRYPQVSIEATDLMRATYERFKKPP